MNNSAAVRTFYEGFIKSYMFGPGRTQDGLPSENEILPKGSVPHRQYACGILFPKEVEHQEGETEVAGSEGGTPLAGQEGADGTEVKKFGKDSQQDLSEEFPANRANEHFPSAVGLSCITDKALGIKITVSGATYQRNTDKLFQRIPFEETVIINEETLEALYVKRVVLIKLENIKNTKAIPCLHIFLRTPGKRATDENLDSKLLTVTFLNNAIYHKKKVKDATDASKDDSCIFQSAIRLSSSDIEGQFVKYPDNIEIQDDELKSLELLYRNLKSYSVGHGCAANWNKPINNTRVSEIWTESMPRHELNPSVPKEIKGLPLSMDTLSQNSKDNSLNICDKLCQAYQEWVNERDVEANTLTGTYSETAHKHLQKCKAALARMKKGVETLRSSAECFLAFRRMNEAMALQQKRYSLTLTPREWIPQSDGNYKIPPFIEPSSFPGLGNWRPFQLAFILMNIDGISDDNSPEREVVDLIWFPTGGGKTEAYLGLTAYTIFLSKIRDKTHSGTTVMMRYTLRLLTTQQFQRAASLICACEKIREDNKGELGAKEITIGLWVGGSVTPNTFASAKTVYNLISRGEEVTQTFVVQTCPWCGCQMGRVSSPGKNSVIKGYDAKTTSFSFKCPDSSCHFSKRLPLQVVDQALYKEPPTLLIGTVDKFASLAWNFETLELFGAGENKRPAPRLVIQDEMHLISGPLGSMVGLYETAIDSLCSHSGNRPKIIASTATVSRAIDQIKSLYDREGFIFPPQGLSISDSFFAREETIDTTSDEGPRGRAYIGIFGSAMGSQIRTQAMLTAGLLQAAKSCGGSAEVVDPYYTILHYYNSLRELGQASATIDAELKEYGDDIRGRLGLVKPEPDKPDGRRYVNTVIELASFIPSHQINDVLQELFLSIAGKEGSQKFFDKNTPQWPRPWPIDICLATSMIQVGLDVPRLGLMVVVGQPKGTAEYIQTSSRVGRSKDKPGLIFTTFNPGKPRDRSHYEHFKSYHQSLYRWVEPTSITPFSLPTKERALHAIAVILTRQFGINSFTKNCPKEVPADIQEKVKEVILKRVGSIDPSESDNTESMLDGIFEKWADLSRTEWGKMSESNVSTSNPQLMLPSGAPQVPKGQIEPFRTPTSMRNVDATCEPYIIQH